MNSSHTEIICTHEDLISERVRLETLIENQKNIIRHDFDELKSEFRKEIKPAIDTANFVKKFVKPETRNQTIVKVGVTLAVDLMLRRALRGSNIVVQVLIPRLLKNYTTHFFHMLRKPEIPPSIISKIRETI
jgi:hypothetical protein